MFSLCVFAVVYIYVLSTLVYTYFSNVLTNLYFVKLYNVTRLKLSTMHNFGYRYCLLYLIHLFVCYMHTDVLIKIIININNYFLFVLISYTELMK